MKLVGRSIWTGILWITALSLAPTPGSLAHDEAFVPAEQAFRDSYQTLKRINWYTSLEDACAAARREGKLVFWIHMLGTVDGAT